MIEDFIEDLFDRFYPAIKSKLKALKLRVKEANYRAIARKSGHFIGIAACMLAAVLVPVISLAWADTYNHARPSELIPLYDGAVPENWTKVCRDSNEGTLVIANIASAEGAGQKRQANWAKVIDNCRRYDKAGVIGYVWTNYGKNGHANIDEIKKDVDDWYKFYPGGIEGVFLDGVSDTVPDTTKSNQDFYRELTEYVHSKWPKGKVVLNFGVDPKDDWTFNSENTKQNADVIVVYEGSYDDPKVNPYLKWKQPLWEMRYPSTKFAAIVYSAPNTKETPQPSSACKRLVTQRIGYVYVGTYYHKVPYLDSIC